MFSVDQVPLDNDVQGWWMSAKSAPFPGFTVDVPMVRVAGRDGVVTGPGTVGARPWKIVLRTTVGAVPGLLALFRRPSVTVTHTGDPSRMVTCTVLSVSDPDVFNAATMPDAPADVAVVLQADSGVWRDLNLSDTSVTLTSASQTVSVLPGMSAPVQDAVVRLKGAVAGVQVSDSGGSWFTVPDVPAAQFVRFEAATGRAWVTTSDVWTGGTEVSGLADFGGPRGVFEVTSKFTDPSVRSGSLVVSSSSRAGASVTVRGRGAYIV